MKKNYFILLIFILFISCKPIQKHHNSKLHILATTGMISDLIKNIGKDRVEVTALMGPGIDPHLYKARISDMAKMFSADIIFYNGLHLEAKLTEVLKKMSRKKHKTITVAVAESIDKSLLRKLDDGQYDMHVWMDISLWMRAAQRILEVLSQNDSHNSDYYKTNGEKYFKEMQQTHDYIKKQILSIPANKRVLITAHDAFNYYSAAYGIEVRAIQGVSTDAEASAGDIRNLADFIAQRKIPAIFVESTVPLKTITALQEAVKSRGFAVTTGAELYADALGDTHSPAGNYLGMMRYNTYTIVNALTR